MATNLIIDVSVVIAAVSPFSPAGTRSKRVNSCSASTACMRPFHEPAAIFVRSLRRPDCRRPRELRQLGFMTDRSIRMVIKWHASCRAPNSAVARLAHVELSRKVSDAWRRLGVRVLRGGGQIATCNLGCRIAVFQVMRALRICSGIIYVTPMNVSAHSTSGLRRIFGPARFARWPRPHSFKR